MAMAKTTKGRTGVPWSEVPGLVAAARDAMVERGKGALGDKSVLDILDAIAAALDGISDPAAMAGGAPRRPRGDRRLPRPARTARPRPHVRRAKSVGIDDPGMLAMALIVEALAGPPTPADPA